ncbi:DNA repair protein RAD51 homolog 4 isoform X2 [Mercurialis annua]|uniref:DNA repair protein RAD51 homolog 4 isoform X2 n=1 Tax=Mercurialis annua TaxID=3986 RepID=UPI00215E33DB|nr:DNA repair protein RAD51 homolog 4 isoform X2 [Mercurialis annua]
MAPINSLEKDHPLLDSSFEYFCASHSIFTVEDFLLQDLTVLAQLAEQGPNSDRLKQGINQVLCIIDKNHHQPWSNGMQFLQDALLNKHVLSTGFQGVDALIGGGLREGQLTELVGLSSSGKTQVCLRVAASIAEQHMGRVIFMDTCNSFSPQRIQHFVDQISGSALTEIMSNILCCPVFDIFSMFDVLHQIEISLKSQGHNGDLKVRSLIVDSISSLITPILGGGGPQGHALMTSAGILLKKLAHEHNIAVLVTNHMVAGDGGNLKPALGESWKSIPHVRLQISRDCENNIHHIIILKHPSQASGKATRFNVDD